MTVDSERTLAVESGHATVARTRRKTRYDNAGYLFILPAMLFFGVFLVYPLFYTMELSFFEWTGYSKTREFVALSNYSTVFSNWVFGRAVRNTVTYAVLQTGFTTLVGLLVALVLDSRLFGRSVFKVVFFTPVLVSIAVISLLWGRIYEPNFGLLNGLLRGVGLDNLAKPWLGDGKLALYAVVLVTVWQGFGYSMVLFIAGLQDIPEEMKEAAKIDGASELGATWYITLPLLRPVLALVTTLTLIGSLKLFEIIYVMTSGGPNHATETVASLLYYEAFRFNRMGVASAIAVLLLFGTMSLSIVQRRLMEMGEAAS
ncbi:MAG: carbohydrate ABC transporter permease [Anaerolineae bacterium]